MTSRLAREWPLAIVLPAQAALTLPWLWRTAPFSDEALYLDAGHQLWAHWLHHAPVPDYASWFSGAPVLYPPLGAVADSAGGLPAARTLSLLLVLGATVAIYFTGLRLFGRIAAFFAAALFAVTGLIVHYGAFATYDAPALFFLAIATWAAVHVCDGRTRWLVACTAALVTANAFKYATLAWDPVIVGLVLLHSWNRGAAAAFARAVSITLTVVIAAGGLLELGGPDYITGLLDTTVTRTIRNGAYVGALPVLWRAFALTGVLILAAVAAVVISIVAREPLPTIAILLLFVLGGILAPVNQARIHELTSLDKNMGFGLIFPPLAAGYALQTAIKRGVAWFPAKRLACAVSGAAAILLLLILGRVQHVQFRGPSIQLADQIVSAIKQGYRPDTYIIASGDTRMGQYYLRQIPESAWMGIYRSGPAARARFHDRICSGRVSLVVMRLAHGSYDHPYDNQLRTLLTGTHDYGIALKAGSGQYVTQVWRLKTAPQGKVCT